MFRQLALMAQNKEDVYDTQIAPIMIEIVNLCRTHGIPFAAVFEYAPALHAISLHPGFEPSEDMRHLQELVDHDPHAAKFILPLAQA